MKIQVSDLEGEIGEMEFERTELEQKCKALEDLVDEANQKLEECGSPTVKKDESLKKLGTLRSSNASPRRIRDVETYDGEAQTDIGPDYFIKM